MSTSTDNRPGFLSVPEVAALLGCSPRTVYTWISMGTIPYRRAGRKVIFDETGIRAWTKAQTNQPNAATLIRR